MNVGPFTGVGPENIGILVPIVFFICMTIDSIHKRKSKSETASAEEAKMIQEVYNGLDRLNDRVESLETILDDSKKKDS